MIWYIYDISIIQFGPKKIDWIRKVPRWQRCRHGLIRWSGWFWEPGQDLKGPGRKSHEGLKGKSHWNGWFISWKIPIENGWFISWKIPFENGWWLGVALCEEPPTMGNDRNDPKNMSGNDDMFPDWCWIELCLLLTRLTHLARRWYNLNHYHRSDRTIDYVKYISLK